MITYEQNLDHIDWSQMKATLLEDDFDNGRTPEQLETSFRNSFAAVIAYDGERIIGTIRALSDGICNAYIVDVWTLSTYRHQGIATKMMQLLMDRLKGQHVYLFTDSAPDFYRKLGFEPRGVGLGRVVGTWLVNE